MPKTKEKLIQLIEQTDFSDAEELAVSLIANGVGFIENQARFMVVCTNGDLMEMHKIIGNGPVIVDCGNETIVPIFPGRWIPVSERLPEYNQRVMVYCESKTIEKHVTACTYFGIRYGAKRWSRHCRNVTHWMPLPQPPKGE